MRKSKERHDFLKGFKQHKRKATKRKPVDKHVGSLLRASIRSSSKDKSTLNGSIDRFRQTGPSFKKQKMKPSLSKRPKGRPSQRHFGLVRGDSLDLGKDDSGFMKKSLKTAETPHGHGAPGKQKGTLRHSLDAAESFNIRSFRNKIKTFKREDKKLSEADTSGHRSGDRGHHKRYHQKLTTTGLVNKMQTRLSGEKKGQKTKVTNAPGSRAAQFIRSRSRNKSRSRPKGLSAVQFCLTVERKKPEFQL